MVDIWWESVRDHEYYERRLREMSVVRDLVVKPAYSLVLVDELIRKNYQRNILEAMRGPIYARMEG